MEGEWIDIIIQIMAAGPGAIFLGYLFGCIQAAYFIGKYKKIDIREHGNSNAGASNTTIVLGWKYGILVAVIDTLKATFSILFLKSILQYYGFNGDLLYFLLYLNGAFVILGHNYPFFLNFRGGKGTASLVGMLIALDWKLALAGIVAIALVTVITNYIAIGTIVMYLVFCFLTWYLDYGIGALSIAVLITFLSVYNHWVNFTRIINKQEKGLRDVIG